MKLIVCGAGVIGSNLAKYLSEERHEVTLIEQKSSVAARVTEKLDARPALLTRNSMLMFSCSRRSIIAGQALF